MKASAGSYLYLLFSLLLIGCHNNRVNLDTLKLFKHKYYADGNHTTPFSGTAVSMFETGHISVNVNFNNGIPDGKWEAFGYDGEVVQNGTHQPISFKNIDIGPTIGVNRINICTTNEGKYTFVDIFLITDSIGKGTDPSSPALIDSLRVILKSKGFNIKNEIHKVISASGEFEADSAPKR